MIEDFEFVEGQLIVKAKANKNRQINLQLHLTGNDEDVPVFIPVVPSMTPCTVTNCEPRGLLANQLPSRTRERINLIESYNSPVFLTRNSRWYSLILV